MPTTNIATRPIDDRSINGRTVTDQMAKFYGKIELPAVAAALSVGSKRSGSRPPLGIEQPATNTSGLAKW